MSRKITEAQYKASTKYKKNNTKAYTISFNLNTEYDLVEYLEQKENITKFIKKLVIKAKEKGEI